RLSRATAVRWSRSRSTKWDPASGGPRPRSTRPPAPAAATGTVAEAAEAVAVATTAATAPCPPVPSLATTTAPTKPHSELVHKETRNTWQERRHRNAPVVGAAGPTTCGG